MTSASRPAHSSTSLKCGSASPGEQLLAGDVMMHRRTFDVVQHPFHQIRCRRQVLQSLLVLNADRVAAELIGDAHGGDVHLALLEHLDPREFGRFIDAKANFIPRPSSQS